MIQERGPDPSEAPDAQSSFTKARNMHFDLTGGDFFYSGLPHEKINPIDNPETTPEERLKLMSDATPRIERANWSFLQSSMDPFAD